MTPNSIHPTEFNVLVQLDAVEKKTTGGILLPEDHRDRKQAIAIVGTVVETSPLAFTYAEWPDDARRPAAGDRVIVAKMSGLEIPGHEGLKLIKDKDIVAVCDQEHAA